MTIYYVDPVSGDDGDAGTDPITSPWATTQKAADTMVADDETRLMNTGTETPSATIDFDTGNDDVIFIAADSAGDPITTGFYTLSGASVGGSNFLDFVTNTTRISFQRVRFTGGGGVGLDLNVTVSIILYDCRIDNFTSHGIQGSGSGSTVTAFNTEIDNNSGGGIKQTTTSRIAVRFNGCSIHDNTGDGLDVGAAAILHNCTIYDNAIGVQFDGNTNAVVTISSCVFHNNSSHGLQVPSGSLYYSNCSFNDNGGFGLQYTTGVELYGDYNHYNNNTSGETDQAATPGQNNQTGEPLFTNETDGSEDFIPLTGSPLLANGANGTDIGAFGFPDGGGLLVHPGMTGGIRG